MALFIPDTRCFLHQNSFCFTMCRCCFTSGQNIFSLKNNFTKIQIFFILAILVRANAKMIHTRLLPVNPDWTFPVFRSYEWTPRKKQLDERNIKRIFNKMIVKNSWSPSLNDRQELDDRLRLKIIKKRNTRDRS